MKTSWIGLGAVVLVAGGLIAYKMERPPAPPQHAGTAERVAVPQVLMVADLSEAGTQDGCGKIIAAVQAAEQRHVRVATFNVGDKSALISRYRVLVSPTVLVLTPDGKVAERFEGESPAVVSKVQASLSKLASD